MPALHLRAHPRLAQTLSPRLQHAVRLLQMSSLEFAAQLQATLDRNPFLEIEEGEEGHGGDGGQGGEGADASASLPPCAQAEPPGAAEEPPEPHAQLQGPQDGADVDDASDRDLWASDIGRPRCTEAGGLGALELLAVQTSLATHLHGQLDVLPLPARDLSLAHALVDSLDDDGYLRTPLVELTGITGQAPEPALQEMQIALRRVQSLDPAGVGARSVAECLQLQLPAIEEPALRALALRIIRDHLPALAARDVPALGRVLGETPERVEAACERIRRLDPRPGWRWGALPVACVVPDLVVRKVRGAWQVQLNPAIVPRLRLNEVYAGLFQRHRTPAHAEMGAHLQEARWTLRNVERRFATILEVADAIVRRQQGFLDDGAMAMKPLGLKEIADELGVHESTVSRVTSHKYMATPLGVLELKYFFSRAMATANGSACSGTALRSLIQELIDAECTEAPLSDAELSRQLGQQGLVVARRTVTKYRQMLKIEPVDRRRRQA